MAFAGWIASLSNGETVFEKAQPPGDVTSWTKLQRRLKSEDLKITMLRLQKGGVTIMAKPKADGYVQCSEIKMGLMSGKQSRVQGIGTIIGEWVIMSWMDENRNVWQDMRPLDDLKIHSTMA